MNDLSKFVYHAYVGLNNLKDMTKIISSNKDVEVYFKLYILLYADDTIIFAESYKELQAALNALFLYCKSCDLEVNQTKTKITIFCNIKLQQQPVCIYNGQELEIDDGFVILVHRFLTTDAFGNINKD